MHHRTAANSYMLVNFTVTWLFTNDVRVQLLRFVVRLGCLASLASHLIESQAWFLKYRHLCR